MATTPAGVEYPGPSWPFPPGFSGEGGAFETMAYSIDAVLAAQAVKLIGTYSNTVPENTSQFSDIPDDFELLKLIWMGRAEDAATTFASLLVRINGDTGNNYYSARGGIRWDSTPTFQNGSTYGVNGQLSMGIVGEQASWGEIVIPRYARSISKDVSARGAARNSGGTAAADKLSTFGEGIWSSTDPVITIRLWPSGFNWAVGMRMMLLGYPKVA